MQELDKDSNSTFKLEAWIMINVACFLLMFATSGISFFASCFFNLTRHSLILGAGLPLSFFLLKLLSDINLSMTELRYFSLNTLYVTESLAKAEGYGLSVAVLILNSRMPSAGPRTATWMCRPKVGSRRASSRIEP